MIKEQVNSLVVGAGRVGERFAKALVEQNCPTTIFDIFPSKAVDLSARLGILSTDDLSLAIKQAKAVYICTPISNHFEIAMMALNEGKAIFCEKPLTDSLKEALVLQEMVHVQNTPFVVGNYYRLNQSIAAAKASNEAGEIGRIISISASYLHDMRELTAGTPWRRKAGFLYDGGVHPVDLACWIAGEKVETVSAEAGMQVDPDYPHPQDFEINLRFPSGLLANIHLNSRARLPYHGAELVIYGSTGTLRAHNKEESLTIFKEGGLYWEERATPQGDLPIDRVVTIMNNIITGRPDNLDSLPGIDEAVGSIRILAAAERSIASGLRVQIIN